MALPKPNYTQVPNLLLDSMWERRPNENLVLFALSRSTFGFHRNSALMSLADFSRQTGLCKHSVIEALGQLIEMDLVDRSPCETGFEYWIVLEGGGSAQNAQGVVHGMHRGSARDALPPPSPYIHFKDSTKERLKKGLRPSIDQCLDYGKEIELSDSEVHDFFDYWESAGWKRKAGPVRDFKASMRLWKSNNRKWAAEKDGSGRKGADYYLGGTRENLTMKVTEFK